LVLASEAPILQEVHVFLSSQAPKDYQKTPMAYMDSRPQASQPA